jgi:DNA (cytosine-5)-methyltransferase 1
MDYMIHTRPSGIRVSKMNWIPALVAMAQIPIIGPWGRRISPREAARAQSFGDDFIIHPKDSVAYKQLGNAVNVELIKRIIKEFKKL